MADGASNGGGGVRRLRRPGAAELTFVGLGLCCVLYPAWHAYRSDKEQRIDQARTALTTTAETTADAVSSWVGEASLRVEWLAARPSTVDAVRTLLRDGSSASAKAAALTEIRAAAAQPSGGRDVQFEDFLVADPAGVVRAASQPGLTGGLLSQSVLDDAGKGRFEAADWRTLTGDEAEPGSAPLGFVAAVSEEGTILGYLALRADAAPAVSRIVARRALGGLGRTRAASESGGWLAATSGRGLVDELCTESPAIVLERARRATAAGYEDCRGVQVLGAMHREPVTGLTILSELPSSAVGGLENKMATAAALAALLGAGLLLLVLSQTRQDAGVPAPASPRPRQNMAAWTILAVCLLATFAAWRTASTRLERQEQRDFQEAIAELESYLERQFERRRQFVGAVASIAQVFGPNRVDEWLELTEAAVERRRHPGLECVALAIASPEGVRVAASTRCPGGAPICNRCADLEEAVRAAAADREDGEPALVRAEGERGRVLIAEPAPPIPAWPPSSRGYVVGRVDLAQWGASAAQTAGPTVEFSLTGVGDDEGVRYYASDPNLEAAAEHDLATRDMSFGDVRMLLRARASAERSESPVGDYPTQVLLAGLAISVLLFDIALVLSSTRARAMGIAELMSRRYQEGEARVRAVIDNAPDGIITFHGSGRISTLNPSARRIFGLEEPDSDVAIVDLIPVCTPAEATRLAAAGSNESQACEGVRSDGTTFPADLRVSVAEDQGKTLFTAIVRDVTARRLAEDRLRESEERYALAARGANDGLWDWDLKANRIYYSARWKAMLGIEAEDEVSDDPDEWLDRVHPDDVLNLRAQLAAHLDGRSPHFECEYRIRHSGGGYRWALCRGIAVRDESGKATRIAGSQTDITDRKRAERQLLYEALHDPLTGLPNRNLFTKQVEKARRRSSAGQGMFALMFLDVDRFKVINDSLGHVFGDRLLVALSERLTHCLRPGDTICRLGGDEFAILVERLHDVSDATRIAERIQQDLTQPVELEGRAMYANVSIGIALSESGRETTEALLRHADLAMYRAKARGKARYELFDKQMHHRAVDRLQLETDLRAAVEREELTLDYQPILDAASNRILSCEALIRWRHPRRGLIRPDDFINVAEESGTIAPITNWVVQEACRQVRAWLDEGLPAPRASVNISPSQLLQQDLYYLVMDALSRFDLSPEAIQLELTEGALIESSEASLNPLRELRDCGVRILLDDFGTGFSSLVYLHGFPIDMIKIDRSFIQQLPQDQTSANLTAGLIALAHNLQLGVVAEGAETEEQLRFLVEHRCDEIQGYIVGRPQAPAALADLLREQFERPAPVSGDTAV